MTESDVKKEEKKPKDFYREDRVGAVRLARLFSNIVSPPTIFAAMGIAVAFSVLPFWDGLLWGGVFGLLLSLLPVICILLLIKMGWIQELHMTNMRERRIPYLVTIGCGFVMLWLTYLFDLPIAFRCVTIYVICNLIALLLITMVWLISLHTTAAAAAAGLIGVMWGWMLGLFIGLPLVITVLWNRLYLKRHTPAQAFSGVALGLGTALSLLLVGCF